MIQKWTLNNTFICPQCIEKLESITKMHAKEWELTCNHFSDGWIRCVCETAHHRKIIEELEHLGYILTTEWGSNWIKIKPLGVLKKNNCKFFYCIYKEHCFKEARDWDSG
jgi:hypothetical protein